MTEIRRASCHCGAVEIEVELPDGLAGAKRCDCSFCRRRQAANVSALTATLKVTRGADNLALYTWGSHTARHYFCKTCGIYTHHQRRSNPAETGVNIGCFEGVNPRELEPFPWSDGVNHVADRD